jgi:hypothetical protein
MEAFGSFLEAKYRFSSIEYMSYSPARLIRLDMSTTASHILFYTLPLVGTISKLLDWISPDYVPENEEKCEKIKVLKNSQMEDLCWLVSRVAFTSLFGFPTTVLSGAFFLATLLLCAVSYDNKENKIQKLISNSPDSSF